MDWTERDARRPTQGILANGSVGVLTPINASRCRDSACRVLGSLVPLNSSFLSLFNDTDSNQIHSEDAYLKVYFADGEKWRDESGFAHSYRIVMGSVSRQLENSEIGQFKGAAYLYDASTGAFRKKLQPEGLSMFDVFGMTSPPADGLACVDRPRVAFITQ